MNLRRTLLALSIGTSLTLGSLRAQITPEEIDLLVGRAMNEFGVVGAAVGVVVDGEVFHCKGYGQRSVDAEGRVDRHTQFAIASNSKAFTTAALAILVDGGQAALARHGQNVHPRVRDVQRLRHRELHHRGSPDAPQRARARRWRLDVLPRRFGLHDAGRRDVLSALRAAVGVPHQVRLRQPPVSRRRRGHQTRHGPELGVVRAGEDPRRLGHGGLLHVDRQDPRPEQPGDAPQRRRRAAEGRRPHVR